MLSVSLNKTFPSFVPLKQSLTFPSWQQGFFYMYLLKPIKEQGIKINVDQKMNPWQFDPLNKIHQESSLLTNLDSSACIL